MADSLLPFAALSAQAGCLLHRCITWQKQMQQNLDTHLLSRHKAEHYGIICNHTVDCTADKQLRTTQLLLTIRIDQTTKWPRPVAAEARLPTVGSIISYASYAGRLPTHQMHSILHHAQVQAGTRSTNLAHSWHAELHSNRTSAEHSQAAFGSVGDACMCVAALPAVQSYCCSMLLGSWWTE